MKFCQKCGKEIMDEAVICPGCGCAVEKEIKKAEVSYEKCIEGAVTTNIISGFLIIVGIICFLFINTWIGAILSLVAEIVAFLPNSKLRNAFKQSGLNRKSKEDKEKIKAIKKDLKSKNPAYKFSIVLGFIDLVFVVIFALFR